VKAGASKVEVLELIQKLCAPIATAQRFSPEQALLKALETPDGKALYAAYCNARP
jgi:hypothetical protein